MPGSAAPNISKSTTPTDNLALSEAELLQQQAEEAKQAMSRALSLFGQSIGHTVDPRTWTKEHPWISLTGAAVGGFVAASLLIPSEEERLLKKLAKLERAAHPQQPVGGVQPPAEKSLVQKILGEVFHTARPIIMSALSAGIAAQQAASQKTQPVGESDPPTASGDGASVDAAQEPGLT